MTLAEIKVREPRKHLAVMEARHDARKVLSEPLEPTPIRPIESLSDILDGVDMALRRYVRFASEEQSWAVALWVAHTYVADRIDVSPRLAIQAPTRGSGKTRLMEVLTGLVCRPWSIVGPSEAVLYRKIERDHPTILLDEADRLFEKSAEDVAGIVQVLNAGHANGAMVPRVLDARKSTLKDWHVYGPIALAGIGTKWPDTLMDRAIIIHLERKAPEDAVSRLRRDDKAMLVTIGEELVGWAESVEDFRVRHLPVELSDRAQDNWEAMLAIATAAGGEWPDRAHAAALSLSDAGKIAVEDDRLEIVALRDVRRVFTDEADPEFLGSVAIVAKMHNLAEAPWMDLTPKPLTTNKLGHLLRTFLVKSKQPERGGPRGYYLAEVEHAWHRLQIG